MGGVVSKCQMGKMGSFHILFEGLLRFNIFIYLFIKRLGIIMEGYGAMGFFTKIL